jgi:hypothetical protein
MSRCLVALVWAALVTPLFGDVLVQDGDYYQSLRVFDEAITMTGGEIGRLVFLGTVGDISGGQINAIRMSGNELNIRGGQVRHISREYDYNANTDLKFHGYYFRVLDYGRSEENSYVIEGQLLDGQFARTGVVNNTGILTRAQPISFITYPGGGFDGDANDDWKIDLADLNLVRNNFGNSGEGDMDGSGLVDLADLNAVRNNFGYDPFTLTADLATGTPAPVPEPSSLTLAALAFAAICVRKRVRTSLFFSRSRTF